MRPDGSENPEFVLNKPRYRQAKILVAGENFGCGSSREHAVWSLPDFGFRCIIAPSFGDIFYWNCFQNGVLPIRLPEEQVKELAAEIEASDRCARDRRSGNAIDHDARRPENRVYESIPSGARLCWKALTKSA